MMKAAFLTVFIVALSGSTNAYVPHARNKVTPPPKADFDFKKVAAATFTAATIATSSAFAPAVEAMDFAAPTHFASSSTIVAEKVVKEGLYRDYEIDVVEQKADDARSTFKAAKETKSKKGKYTALLAVLIVGSFIIPMAQYFWYVRDDDSSDNFFASQQRIPEPEPEPPKKKGWFN